MDTLQFEIDTLTFILMLEGKPYSEAYKQATNEVQEFRRSERELVEEVKSELVQRLAGPAITNTEANL